MSTSLDLANPPDKFWHCAVKVAGEKNYSVVNDLSFADIKRTIVDPWNNERPFAISGTVIRSQASVAQIKITYTQDPQQLYANQHDAECKRGGVADFVTNRRMLPIDKGTDYTNELLFSDIATESKHTVAETRAGTRVFIGHGGSSVWKDLKDYVHDRLSLPWDEFNRVPIAGVTNIDRLSAMLDAAAIAFLVMTAEDERTDGTVQARMNVIHEAGLFQGRLGFTKAIVMLEEGCEEFSNISGLGQIRFPSGNISAVFTEVRGVLEREKIL